MPIEGDRSRHPGLKSTIFVYNEQSAKGIFPVMLLTKCICKLEKNKMWIIVMQKVRCCMVAANGLLTDHMSRAANQITYRNIA